MSQQPISVKLVVVGDACVGKTCVLISYTQDRFPTDYVPTVFQNYAATIKVDRQSVNLGLWDTAGQEEYNRLRPLAYPNCDVFLIVFSVIDPDSFINAKKRWYPQLQQNVPNVPKIFIGNKIDLRDEYRKKYQNTKNAPIEKQMAEKIIYDQFGSENIYYECSALTRAGIKNIFQQAMRKVIQSKTVKSKPKKKEGANEQGPSYCSSCNIM